MSYNPNNFTMSFAQARDAGIDYRDYAKVYSLPSGAPLTAIAGVWGDYSFEDADGNKYLRNIRKWGDAGYFIKELNLDAKAIEAGQMFSL